MIKNKLYFTYFPKLIYLLIFAISLILFSCNKYPIDAVFTTTPKRIQQGDSTILKWDVFTNPDVSGVSLAEIQESAPMIGEISVNPEQSKTYYLKVINKRGKEKRFMTRVMVLPPDFEMINYPKIVEDEDPVLIYWKTRNASSVMINGVKDTLPASGYYSILLDSTRQFTIKAFNKNGRVSEKTLHINTRIPDKIYGDSILCKGEEILLSWNFQNSTKVRISGIDKDFNAIDQYSLKPEKSMLYKFIAYRKNGETFKKSFRVFVLPEDMVKFSFPEKVERGGEIDLSWTVKNIDSLRIAIDKKTYKKPSNGSIRQKINNDTKFELIFKYKGLTYRYPKYIQIVERKFIKGTKPITDIGSNTKLNFEIFGIDKSKYPEEIKLYVLVADTSGYFVTNLLTENDRKNSFRKYFKQLVETVEEKQYPVNDFNVKEIYNITTNSDFSVVLDYSGSMSTDIKYLEQSMSKFIKLVDNQDRISIVKFDDRLDSVIALSNNKVDIQEKFGFKGLVDMGGGTALYAGTDLGFNQFDSVSSNTKRLLLFTDGNENSSYSYMNNYAVTANGVIAKSRKNNIPMYIVSYGSGTNMTLLDEMASLSGGKHYNIRNHNSIEKVLGEFEKTTRNFYEITYKPMVAEKERTIELIYNNNTIKTGSTTSKFYIGEDYDLMPIELNNGNSEGFVSLSDSLKKISKLKPTASPQVITLFDFDKRDILPKYQEVIVNYVKIMKEKPLCEAVLIGHTDRVGSDEYCYILSKKRANEIKDALVKQGIDSDRIKTLGFGKLQPIWNPEKNEIQAHENRRVEVIILE